MDTKLTPAELWVEALKSGEFKQGQGRLLQQHDGSRYYCCLGVACEVYRRETGQGEWRERPGFETRLEFHEEGGKHGSVLPLSVQRWLGVSNCDGTFVSSRDQLGRALLNTLVGLNDGGYTFDQIADVIVERPEKLFGEPTGRGSSGVVGS